RDLMHVDDVWRLIRTEILGWERVEGRTYNVGGGSAVSLSLLEATNLCREIVGRRIDIGSQPQTAPSDIRVYVSDHAAVTRDTGWTPTHDPRAILGDLHSWMITNHDRLAPIFNSAPAGA